MGNDSRYPRRVRLLVKFVVVAFVIGASPQVLDAIHVRDGAAAAKAALLYGLLFVLLGWLVRVLVAVLSIVPGVLTLGLFFLLVPLIANTILLRLTADLMSGFSITTWWAAFVLSAALSLVNVLFERKQSPQ